MCILRNLWEFLFYDVQWVEHIFDDRNNEIGIKLN